MVQIWEPFLLLMFECTYDVVYTYYIRTFPIFCNVYILTFISYHDGIHFFYLKNI